jgi:hypothetical protein
MFRLRLGLVLGGALPDLEVKVSLSPEGPPDGGAPTAATLDPDGAET